MVSEVNAVSEELNKYKSFEVVLISAAAQEGLAPTKTRSVGYLVVSCRRPSSSGNSCLPCTDSCTPTIVISVLFYTYILSLIP